jgi:hypothetical protein
MNTDLTPTQALLSRLTSMDPEPGEPARPDAAPDGGTPSAASEDVTLPGARPSEEEPGDSVAALLAPFGEASPAGAARPDGARGAGVAPGESITQPPARVAVPRRRGPADPVRAVMHRHHAMVAGAVDVWEVAAGLEACGVSDGEARRLRHRDVFGLAEELYARVPRAGQAPAAAPPAPAGGPGRLGGRAVAAHLLPGAGCVLAAGLPVAAAPVAVAVALALWWALRSGPLRVAYAAGAAPWTYGLLGFALYGPQALTALAGRGPFDAGAGTAAFAALALSLLPAAALARWFAAAARAQLAPSHGLADFADAVRPRLAAALAGYAAALTALLLLAAAAAGSAPLAGPLALGVLLFTARLLTVHGHPAPAASALAAACVAEALTFALAAAPGHLAPPGGTAEAAACTAAALVLTAQSLRLLGRAASHHPRPATDA